VLESQQDIKQHIDKIFKVGFDRFVTQHKSKDGKLIDVEVSITVNPVKTGMTAFLRDITARKRAEEELENAYEQLKFTQAQLVQSEKLEAVGRIASGVAHEVKNPLGIVLQSANYLESNLPQEQKNTAEVILVMKNNIMRADRIIRGLVDFSRMAELRIQPENINAILESSLNLIQHQARLDEIKTVKDLSAGLPEVLVDKGKIEQVFVNLFLNAIQAMPKGGKLIVRSYLGPLDRQGKNIGKRSTDYFMHQEQVMFVEVEDTGVGIPSENIPKVFDPFFTTKDPGSGTGLGLSVSKNIIDLHKALIDIQSQEGKGTKVTVILKTA
jgi:signal transduction histidine kinase